MTGACAGFVFSGLREYVLRSKAGRTVNAGIGPDSAATRPGCMHCIQLYSDAICIQIRLVSTYCRKGFQNCIQCIQRIPTPFVFRFSLLLGREYMNTRPGGMMGYGRRFRHDPPPAAGNAEKRPCQPFFGGLRKK